MKKISIFKTTFFIKTWRGQSIISEVLIVEFEIEIKNRRLFNKGCYRISIEILPLNISLK